MRRTNPSIRPYNLVLDSHPSFRYEIRVMFILLVVQSERVGLWLSRGSLGWLHKTFLLPRGRTISHCTKHFMWKMKEWDHETSTPFHVPPRCCGNTNHWIFPGFFMSALGTRCLWLCYCSALPIASFPLALPRGFAFGCPPPLFYFRYLVFQLIKRQAKLRDLVGSLIL